MKLKDFPRAIYWTLPEIVTNKIQSLRNERCSEKKIYRPYFEETKSIYIHIPKVAGRSISYALYGDDPMHHKLIFFESLNKEKFKQYFKFGFVRNPWSRLYSIYNYLKDQNKKYPYGIFYWINRFGSFENFIMNGLNENVINKYMFLNSQYSYLIDSSGSIGVDFLGRFETIEKDFYYVAIKIGAKARIEKNWCKYDKKII